MNKVGEERIKENEKIGQEKTIIIIKNDGTIFELLSLLCQAWFYFRQANQHMEMDQEQLNWYQFRKAKITRILSIHRKQFKSVNYFCV